MPFLRISTGEKKPHGSGSLRLAPGQSCRIGRIKQHYDLTVPDRLLAPVHIELSVEENECFIRDVSDERPKHAGCAEQCFTAELRHARCPDAICRVYNISRLTGVYLNGRRVQHAKLKDADTIAAGTSWFRVELRDVPFAAPAPDANSQEASLTPAQQATAIAQLEHEHVYALLDAAHGPVARSLRLEHEDLAYSLYDGPAAEKLADVRQSAMMHVGYNLNVADAAICAAFDPYSPGPELLGVFSSTRV